MLGKKKQNITSRFYSGKLAPQTEHSPPFIKVKFVSPPAKAHISSTKWWNKVSLVVLELHLFTRAKKQLFSSYIKAFYSFR